MSIESRILKRQANRIPWVHVYSMYAARACVDRIVKSIVAGTSDAEYGIILAQLHMLEVNVRILPRMWLNDIRFCVARAMLTT